MTKWLTQPFARIGAHPRSEVVLSGEGMPSLGLYLHVVGSRIYCFTLDAPAGEPRAGHGWLEPNADIRLGGYRIQVAIDDRDSPANPGSASRPAEKAPDHGLQLRIQLPNVARQAWLKAKQRRLTMVGREAPSQLLLRHASVSRRHCVLYWDNDCVWVIDLFSTAGTFVEGERIDVGRLGAGEVLAVGEAGLHCQLTTEHEHSSMPATLANDVDRAGQREDRRERRREARQEHSRQESQAQREQIAGLQAQVTELEQALAAIGQEHASALEQGRALSQRLQTRLTESQAELDGAVCQVAEFKARISEMERALAALSHEHASTIEQERARSQQLQLQLTESEAARDEAKGVVGGLQSQIAEWDLSLTAAKHERAVTQEREAALSQRLEMLLTESDAARDEAKGIVGGLQSQIAELNQELTALRLDHDAILNENQSNREVLQRLQAQLLATEAQRDQATADCERFKSQAFSLELRLAELEEDRHAALTNSGQLESLVAELRREHASLPEAREGVLVRAGHARAGNQGSDGNGAAASPWSGVGGSGVRGSGVGGACVEGAGVGAFHTIELEISPEGIGVPPSATVAVLPGVFERPSVSPPARPLPVAAFQPTIQPPMPVRRTTTKVLPEGWGAHDQQDLLLENLLAYHTRNAAARRRRMIIRTLVLVGTAGAILSSIALWYFGYFEEFESFKDVGRRFFGDRFGH